MKELFFLLFFFFLVIFALYGFWTFLKRILKSVLKLTKEYSRKEDST